MRNGTSRDNRTRNRRQLPPAVQFGPFGPSAPLRNPQPPYSWLDEESLESIHQASLTILEEIGLDFLDAEALSLWAKAGARVDLAAQHVWIDRGLVLQAIDSAPPTFRWRARNPAHDVPIGGSQIAFGPTGGMVYVHDLSGGRRTGTMADLEMLMKLAQLAGVLHFGCWEQVTPQDVTLSQRHLRRLFAGLTLTDKPVMEAAHGRVISADNIAMAFLAMGWDPDDVNVPGHAAARSRRLDRTATRDHAAVGASSRSSRAGCVGRSRGRTLRVLRADRVLIASFLGLGKARGVPDEQHQYGYQLAGRLGACADWGGPGGSARAKAS